MESEVNARAYSVRQVLTIVHSSGCREHCLWRKLGYCVISVTKTAQVEPKIGRVYNRPLFGFS